jgi:hypothetical protein
MQLEEMMRHPGHERRDGTRHLRGAQCRKRCVARALHGAPVQGRRAAREKF